MISVIAVPQQTRYYHLMKPQLIIEQKITAFVNKYAIYTADEHGQKDTMIAFAQQKRLAFKEKVIFYTNDTKSDVAFTFRAEKVMDIHGRYFVEDAQGLAVGTFKKDFTKSLVNSTWSIFNKQQEPTFTLNESSHALAAIRRFGGLIPIVGDIIDIVVLFLRYHFVFRDATTGEEVGRYQKTTLFRDHYLLSMDDEAYGKEDWRVLAAMAVGLDALQSR